MSDSQVYVPALSTGVSIDNITVSTGVGVVYRQRVATVAAPYTQQIDYNGGTNATYVGIAIPGTSTASAGWTISFFTYDANNNPTSITWAQVSSGTPASNLIWTSRASYTYS